MPFSRVPEHHTAMRSRATQSTEQGHLTAVWWTEGDPVCSQVPAAAFQVHAQVMMDANGRPRLITDLRDLLQRVSAIPLLIDPVLRQVA